MDQVIPYLDYLIGNESEALAYSESHNWGITDITEIAKKLANLPKINPSRRRQVVITQGTEPTIVASATDSEPSVQAYPVRKINPAEITDTNGAGYGTPALLQTLNQKLIVSFHVVMPSPAVSLEAS